MHSLKELNDFLISKQIVVKEFSGWYLKVGRDTWTLCQDVFYRNNEPIKTLKDKTIFEKYKKEKEHVEREGIQIKKWRGISSRNRK